MRFACLFAALYIAMAASAQAAGVQLLELPVGDGAVLKGAIWSPCAEPPGEIAFRRVEIAGTRDCAVEGEALPLIVLSHGARGWFGGHHDTAAALADAGFVVAAITHPDAGRRRWRTDRPEAIKALIDHMLTAWPERARLDPERIGFFGYSRGGYTGLVLLGAEPDFRWFLWHCLFAWSDPMCAAPPEREGAEEEAEASDEAGESYAHDPRIRAAVLAAPLAMVFSATSLEPVSAKIQLWRPEKDELLLYPNHADALSRLLPETPDYRVIPDAGHFAVLAPCSPAQLEAAPAICKDAPGFDRAAFHQSFNAEVAAFFAEALSSP